jgi:hypothetical protein
MEKDTKKLQQCEYCGALMSTSLFGGVCKDCMEQDKQLFDKARGCLNFGEKILPEELAEKSGVDLRHIQRWAEIGRFGVD